MSVALYGSGQHCNEHSIVISSSLFLSVVPAGHHLSSGDHDDTPPVALELYRVSRLEPASESHLGARHQPARVDTPITTRPAPHTSFPYIPRKQHSPKGENLPRHELALSPVTSRRRGWDDARTSSSSSTIALLFFRRKEGLATSCIHKVLRGVEFRPQQCRS